jgi:hypothetical protein
MPRAEGQIRVVSDGSDLGTSVYVGDQLVEGVTEVSWHVRIGGIATATVQVENVAVEVDARGQITSVRRG